MANEPVLAGWRPLTANATSYGLIMLIAYLTAAWWCLRAANRCREHPDHDPSPNLRHEHLLWQAMAAFLAMLAIYRQLDLADLLTELGRATARHGNWYRHRRPFQIAMVWGIGTLVVVAAAALFWSVSALAPPVRIALAACAALVFMLGINVFSLHAVDRLLHLGYGRADVYNLVESGSLATILAASGWSRRLTMAADRS